MFFLLTIGFAQGRTTSAHPRLPAVPLQLRKAFFSSLPCVPRDSVEVLQSLWEPVAQ